MYWQRRCTNLGTSAKWICRYVHFSRNRATTRTPSSTVKKPPKYVTTWSKVPKCFVKDMCSRYRGSKSLASMEVLMSKRSSHRRLATRKQIQKSMKARKMTIKQAFTVGLSANATKPLSAQPRSIGDRNLFALPRALRLTCPTAAVTQSWSLALASGKKVLKANCLQDQEVSI